MLPWNERVTMLSINPDAATRDDIARLASELMQANEQIEELREQLKEKYSQGIKDGLNQAAEIVRKT